MRHGDIVIVTIRNVSRSSSIHSHQVIVPKLLAPLGYTLRHKYVRSSVRITGARHVAMAGLGTGVLLETPCQWARELASLFREPRMASNIIDYIVTLHEL